MRTGIRTMERNHYLIHTTIVIETHENESPYISDYATGGLPVDKDQKIVFFYIVSQKVLGSVYKVSDSIPGWILHHKNMFCNFASDSLVFFVFFPLKHLSRL